MDKVNMKKLVRRALAGIALFFLGVVAVVAFAVATAPTAHAATAVATPEFRWQHFGVAPYAPSREAAMKPDGRKKAFHLLGLPGPVVDLFMLATDNPGERDVIVNRNHFDAMLSKGGVVNRNVVVDFIKPPVSGKMEYAAPAEKWQVTWHGKVYALFLPEICNNWSVSITDAPAPPLQPVVAPAPTVFAPPKAIEGSCPDVFYLKVYALPREAMNLPGVALTAAKEEREERFGGKGRNGTHVSRTHYTEFQEALAAGKLHYSSVPHVFRVSLIMSPEVHGGPPIISKEEVLGDITVQGFYREVPFTRAQLEQWDEIRLVPIPDQDIMSPPRYHATGLHEMRVFNRPGLGEWTDSDVGADRDCTRGVAFITQDQ